MRLREQPRALSAIPSDGQLEACMPRRGCSVVPEATADSEAVGQKVRLEVADQDLRDYFAGRSTDVDAILNWAETQTSEIAGVPSCGVGELPLLD